MDKYIMPKLTGFDGNRYLNIDFSRDDIYHAYAIRIENYLLINMNIYIGNKDTVYFDNFLRDIKIKSSETSYFAVCNRHMPSTGAGLSGNVTAYYNTTLNRLRIRSSTTSDSGAISFIIILPIEEGF